MHALHAASAAAAAPTAASTHRRCRCAAVAVPRHGLAAHAHHQQQHMQLPKLLSRRRVQQQQQQQQRRHRPAASASPPSPAPAASCRGAAADGVSPVPDLLMSGSSDDEEQLRRDADFLERLVTAWLDEEWTPLDAHKALGAAAAAAYLDARRSGDGDDVSSLVLALSQRLLAVDRAVYREAFVGAFDVANKSVEALMLRDGVPVCCVTDEDAERVARCSSSGSSSSGSSNGGSGGGVR